MKLLEDRILKDGVVLPGDVLKVDSFLNQLIDTELVDACAAEWYQLFKDAGITKILTIEASGIGIACITARRFNVPVLFAKKSRASAPSTEVYSTTVVSFTHGHTYDVIVPKAHLRPTDKVLIIDDLLANGSAMKALISLCKKSGAEIAGCGVAIEKAYFNGGAEIRALGYHVEALARIASIGSDGSIEFC